METLGRYRILGELGRGAMGAVYRAVDPLIEREVAIKTLLPNLPEEVMAEVRERFIREARSAGRLNHPNIVTIFDVGEQDGMAYIAMELLEGRSLQQMLRDPERMPFDTVAEVIAQVAEALDAAQQYKIVHRDVKPANIMVGPGGRAKLADFGVAHVEASSMTQTGTALGSPKYMSPEQVLGLPVDPRSDIFSLGVVLYEMLARRTPFERASDTTVFTMMHRIAGEPHPRITEIDPTVPKAFEPILDRALAKKPEDRYQRAGELANDLRNYRTGSPGGAAAAPAAAPQPYEKTVAVQTLSRPPTPEEDLARTRLVQDLDKFVANFEREEQDRIRAEQEALARKQAELDRWAQTEALKRSQFEQGKQAGGATDPGAQTVKSRTGALDALRRQAAAAPAQEDKAEARAKAIASLDAEMRAAHRYLAEFVKELNTLQPASGRPYEFIYLGKLAALKLVRGRVEERVLRVEGKNVCELVGLRFGVQPAQPLQVSVAGDDILRCKRYLESLQVEFKAGAEARNEAGLITRAQFTVAGALPCEINLRADYTGLAVLMELINVRRVGRVQVRVPAPVLPDIVDDIARYALGVDDDLEKVLKPSR